MENLLDEKTKKQVRDVFRGLKHPVRMIFFSTKDNCEYCDQIRQLITEVASLSDLISVEEHDFIDDPEAASQYHVDKSPVFLIAGVDGNKILDFGVRIAGIPAGHEFTSLINSLMIVSGRDSGLSEQTRLFLKGLSKPVKLQVFVTPT